MEKIFRGLGWLEGASLLILLFIAMPLKYLAGQPLAVKFVGMAHGILFIAYVIAAMQMSNQQKWPNRVLIFALILSCLPFGTFIFERRYLLNARS